MRIIDQLVYKITGDTKGFEDSMKRSDKSVDLLAKALTGLSAVAIAGAIKKLGDMTIAVGANLDHIEKLSQKIGLSTKGFQEWSFIMQQNGASIDGLQMGLKTLSQMADQATQGGAEQIKMFQRLGVEYTDINGQIKDQETLFNETVEALAGMTNATERTALASRLLGRSATELAPLLNSGKEAIEATRAEAHALGAVFEDDVIDKGVELSNALGRLTASFTALKTGALSPLIPAITGLANLLAGADTAGLALDKTTNDLLKTSSKYKELMGLLKQPVENLTEAERERLEVLAEIARLESEDLMKEMAKAYDKTTAKIEEQKGVVESYQLIEAEINERLEERAKWEAELAQLEGQRYEDLSKAQKATYRTATSQLEQLQSQASLEDELRVTNLERLDAQKKVDSMLSQQEAKVRQLAQAYREGTIEIELYTEEGSDLFEKIKAQADVFDKQESGIKRARETFSKYTISTAEGAEKLVETFTKLANSTNLSTEKQSYYAEMLRLVGERQSELAQKALEEAQSVEELESARSDLIATMEQELANIDKYGKVFGESFDVASAKTALLENAIKALIDSGLDPMGEVVQGLRTQLTELGYDFVEVAEEVEEALPPIGAFASGLDNLNARLIVTGDELAYTRGLISLMENHLIGLVQNGLDPTSKAYEDWAKQIDVLKNKLAEQEKALLDVGEVATQVMGGISGMLSQVGSLQKAMYDARIQQIDSQLQAELQAIDDRLQAELEANGLTEETTLQRLEREYEEAKRIGDLQLAESKRVELERVRLTQEADDERARIAQEYDDEKKRIEIEAMKRQKEIAIFQAVIDTASAIIANLKTWWMIPLITATGALQLSAIQAQPIPSFDVGSIRIPQDTQAMVHRDEMILPAPMAQQAREEGITITPTGGGDPIHLALYLDSRMIGETVVEGINRGQYGRIEARVIK